MKEGVMASFVSMTGFGSAVASANGFTARAEIRCVNHRALRLEVRSRPTLGIWERDLREMIAKEVRRGAIEVAVMWARQRESASLPQEQMVSSAVNTMRALAQRLGLAGEIRASDLVQLFPLWSESWEEPPTAAEWATIAQAAGEALAQAVAMRRREGASLAEAIAACLPVVEDFVAQAQARAPAIVSRWRERLTARLAEIKGDGLAAADEQAIAREICLMAERSDIQEEMARLSSHVAQCRRILAEGGDAGKRLEFLAQEMLREINTAATKAAAADIAEIAVSAKLAVEKIKEQAANVE